MKFGTLRIVVNSSLHQIPGRRRLVTGGRNSVLCSNPASVSLQPASASKGACGSAEDATSALITIISDKQCTCCRPAHSNRKSMMCKANSNTDCSMYWSTLPQSPMTCWRLCWSISSASCTQQMNIWDFTRDGKLHGIKLTA
jgi:hypothetical protein